MKLLRQNTGGYTIIEVMVVLTVSAALFVAAIAGYSAQNQRTQFSQSVQAFAQNLQDISNDIDTGYYPTNQNFSCSAGSTGAPNINTGASAEQGSNSDCVFIGKAIQFAPSGEPGQYEAYTIVGRRLVEGTNNVVSKLEDAKPVSIPGQTDVKELSAGVEILNVKTIGGSQQSLSLLAIVADSGTADISANSGFNTRTTLAGIAGNLNRSKSSFIGQISSLGQANIGLVSQGVDICLREEGGTKTAIITLGGSDRSKLSIETVIGENLCS